MPAEHKTIELPTIAGGAALELFDSAVGKILENLQDINTGEMNDSGKTREEIAAWLAEQGL